MSTDTIPMTQEQGEQIAKRIVELVLPTLEQMTKAIVRLERRLRQLELEER